MPKTVIASHGSPLRTTASRIEPLQCRTKCRRIPTYSAKRLAGIVFFSLALCSLANYLLAFFVGLPLTPPWSKDRSLGTYRRIGPETGPQVFTAGSSLLESALSWPVVSESLGKGIENWSAGGSSPEVWELFQRRRSSPALTIVGVSMYDLNEMRLTPDRASYVPLRQSISDLWTSGADSGLSSRILSQYAMMYVRVAFPTAGWADKVQVGLRRRLADAGGFGTRLGEHEGVVLEREGVLDPGESTMKLNEWSSGRVRRRLADLRAENHGVHEFLHGPKRRAFERMLLIAREHGGLIVVVLPVSRTYIREFLDENTLHDFENMLNEDMKIVPEATVVRLDRLPAITDDSYFADLVHMNSYGRTLTTPVFMKEISGNQ